jgi:hypothetical protein
MNNLKWLQEWYAGNCDGEWEHAFGIKIETLDNPGWLVKIALNETKYEGKFDFKMENDNGDDDWIACTINSFEFEGGGDMYKLGEIIGVFRGWIESNQLHI